MRLIKIKLKLISPITHSNNFDEIINNTDTFTQESFDELFMTLEMLLSVGCLNDTHLMVNYIDNKAIFTLKDGSTEKIKIIIELIEILSEKCVNTSKKSELYTIFVDDNKYDNFLDAQNYLRDILRKERKFA